ncbi:MAG: DUF4194 domain-containing protein [Bacilli bacterium]|nr:DUF4194 domain-containing protein [Bacillales bacterium]MDY2574488.1 DUF4194 domain-containing protein [Bacilli bacterium]
MFFEEYEKFSNADKEEFAHVVNTLMLKSFILRENYDRHLKMMKSNRDYSFCERNIDLIREYLEYSGWTIEKDSRLGVISINNEYQENHIRLDFLTSVMVYGLRYIYECAREENQMTSEVLSSANELLKVLIDKGLIKLDKKPSAVSMASCYRFLENHNIINRVSGEFKERTFTFYILPSILYVIDMEKINAIFDEVSKFGLDN